MAAEELGVQTALDREQRGLAGLAKYNGELRRGVPEEQAHQNSKAFIHDVAPWIRDIITPSLLRTINQANHDAAMGRCCRCLFGVYARGSRMR
jgi:hypothetical protein